MGISTEQLQAALYTANSNTLQAQDFASQVLIKMGDVYEQRDANELIKDLVHLMNIDITKTAQANYIEEKSAEPITQRTQIDSFKQGAGVSAFSTSSCSAEAKTDLPTTNLEIPVLKA